MINNWKQSGFYSNVKTGRRDENRKEQNSLKASRFFFSHSFIENILIDHFFAWGTVVSAGIPGTRPRCLFPRVCGVEPQAPPFSYKDYFAVSSEEVNEVVQVSCAGGGDCPSFPNPPSTGLGELHGFLHQQSSQTVAFTTGDPPGSCLVRASLWKLKANHKHIMGLRIREDSNPCSVKLLEKAPSICQLLSWYLKSCIFK